MRRLLPLLARALVTVVEAAVLVVLLVVLLVHVPAGQRAVRRELEQVLGEILQARVQVGRVTGDVFRHVGVERLVVRFPDGPTLRVPRARITWSLPALLAGEIRVVAARVDHLRLRARHDADGWGLPERPPTEPSAWEPVIRLERVRLAGGRVAVTLADAAPVRHLGLADVTGTVDVLLGPGHVAVDVVELVAVPRGLAVSPLALRGTFQHDADGAVVVSGVRLDTARTHLAADGIVVPRRRVALRATVLPLAAAELRAALPGVPLDADVRGRVALRGPWDAVAARAVAALGPAGHVKAQARVDVAATPPRWVARADLHGVAPERITPDLPPARLTGRVAAAGRGTAARLAARWRVHLEDSVVAARPLTALRLAGTSRGGRHRADASLRLPAGRVTGRVAVVTAAMPAWQARLRTTLPDLAALAPEVPGHLTARLAGHGRGLRPSDRVADIDVAVAPSELRGVPVRAARLAATLRGQRLDVARLRVDADGARADAWGHLDLEGPSDLVVTASADLAALRPAPTPGLAGRLGLRATARGPRDALVAEVGARVDGPRLDAAAARVVTVVARGTDLLDAAPQATVALAVAELRLPDRAPWSGRADVAWRRDGAADVVRLDVGASAPEGGTLDVGLAGRRDGTRTTGTLDRLAFAAPGVEQNRWTLAAPTTVSLDGEAVRLDGVTLVAGRQRARLAGRLALHGPVDAALALDDVRLAPVCTLLGHACEGRLTANATLAGTAAAPAVVVDGRITELGADAARYGTVTLAVRGDATSVEAHVALRHPEAGVLTLDGTVPVQLAWDGPRQDTSAAPLDLALRTDRFDLRILPLFAPRVVREVQGRLTADLAVRGPRSALRATGTLDVDAPRVVLPVTGVTYEQVRLALRAVPDAIEVTTFSARAGGTITGDGRIALREGLPDALDLRLVLDEFLAVRLPAYEAALDGRLDVTGTLAAPRVAGKLAVARAVVRPALLPEATPEIAPDPTITYVGLPPGPEEPADVAGPGLMQSLALELAVSIDRNAWIRRADANIELGGALRVDKATWGPTRVSGTIRLVRGWYAFQGRRFNLDEGTILFSGDDPPNPSLEVTASYRAGDTRVFVEIGGTAEKPTLTLSSDPAMEQGDILAVLLFGKPASELGRGESLDFQRQALSLASGYVMPELRTSVLETLGLDTFEVGMEEVRAGRYVAQDVFVSLAQEYGTQAGQIVGIEYSLTPSVSVKASTSTRGNSSVDLQWHRRY